MMDNRRADKYEIAKCNVKRIFKFCIVKKDEKHMSN